MRFEPELAQPAAAEACLRLGIEPELAQALATYLVLLERWNRKHNLTAITGLDSRVRRHLLESLVLEPWLRGSSILDVGSGAGLPGLILAIRDQVAAQAPQAPQAPQAAQADRRYLLLDSALKKARFLRAVVAELRLGNVAVEHRRVEDFRPEKPFSTVVSRAFAEPGRLLALVSHLTAPGGRLLAMIGQAPKSAWPLPEDWVLRELASLSIPGGSESRHVAVFERLPA